MSNYKVGDKIKQVKPGNLGYVDSTILEIDTVSHLNGIVTTKQPIVGTLSGFEVYGLPVINKETKMSKISKFIKNLTLSADEKALRQVGFKDESGAFTSDAYDVIEEKMANDNIQYLVDIANGIIAEDKTK